MEAIEIKYGVALLSRDGEIASWAIGGLNDSGKKLKVRTSRTKNDAHKFAMPSAQSVARKLAAWGYCPVIVDMATDQVVETFKATPVKRPAPKPRVTLASAALDLVKTMEELNGGQPDQQLRDLIKPLLGGK